MTATRTRATAFATLAPPWRRALRGVLRIPTREWGLRVGGRFRPSRPSGGGGVGPCPGLSAAPWRRRSCRALGRRSSAAGARPRPVRPPDRRPSSPAWCGRRNTTGPRSSTGRWIPAPSGALCVAGLAWALFCYMAAADAALAAWPARVRPPRRARRGHPPRGVRSAWPHCSPAPSSRSSPCARTRLLDTVFAGSGDVQVAQPSPLADLGITTTIAPTTDSAVDRRPARRTTTVADHRPTPPTTVPTRRRSPPVGGTSRCSAAMPGRTAGGCGPTP